MFDTGEMVRSPGHAFTLPAGLLAEPEPFDDDAIEEPAPAQRSRPRSLAEAARRARTGTPAGERTLPVSPALADLLPDGDVLVVYYAGSEEAMDVCWARLRAG